MQDIESTGSSRKFRGKSLMCAIIHPYICSYTEKYTLIKRTKKKKSLRLFVSRHKD